MTAKAEESRPPRYGMGVFTAILGLLSAFGPMSIDMYLPSLPALVGALSTDHARVQLTLSAFLIGFGLGQLIYGPLADRFGRKRPLMAGLVLYILASIACTTAESIEALILFRLLQALGGCAGTVISRAMVRDIFGRDRAARVMSMLMLVMGAAPMLAPLVGAQVMLAWDWRAIFWVLAGFGLLSLLAVAFFLGESLPPDKRRQAGVMEMAAGYLHLLGQRRYLGYVFTSSLMFGGMFAFLSGSPFVYIDVFGVAPEHYGLLFGLNVIGMIIGSAVNSRIVLRLGSDRLLRRGVAAAATAGIALMLVGATGFGGLPAVVAAMFCFMSGLSFIGANAMAGALALYPHMAGTASALAGTTQFALGACTGVLVGILHNGTALPMTAVIGCTGIAAFLVYRFCLRGDA